MTTALEAPRAVAPELAGPRSLYVHIPFCERKCEYCDFASQPGRDGEAVYVDTLRAEIRALAAALPDTELDTVFVGGGTPSFIDPGRLGSVLAEVRRAFLLASDAEVTLEANPSSTSRARATAWLEAGFNRVSLGVQSLEPDILAFLGRVHDAGRALAAVAEVREAGFVRVNCDLIYAVPGLDDRRWASTLDRIAETGPGHVSAYELTVESGTPLHALVRRGTVTPVDAEVALRQHWITVARLAAAGYRQYEVSNFAQPGEECRHNVRYWRRGHYLAAGVGAHGHVAAAHAARLGLDAPAEAVSVRYWHARRVASYLRDASGGRLPIQGFEAVDAGGAEAERVMLGLRLAEGVAMPRGRSAVAGELISAGLLSRRADRVVATARGQEVLDSVIGRLVG